MRKGAVGAGHLRAVADHFTRMAVDDEDSHCVECFSCYVRLCEGDECQL